MTVKEGYEAIGGNYTEIMGRLMQEDRVLKFSAKFLNDPSYENLIQAMEEENYEEAFRAAHTIKGVCQNLAYTKLYKSAHEITEALRSKNIEEAAALLPKVTADYEVTIAGIREMVGKQ